jgi:hypothetical protein
MEVDNTEVDKMEVGNMEVDKMEVGKMEVDKMEVGNMKVGKRMKHLFAAPYLRPVLQPLIRKSLMTHEMGKRSMRIQLLTDLFITGGRCHARDFASRSSDWRCDFAKLKSFLLRGDRRHARDFASRLSDWRCDFARFARLSDWQCDFARFARLSDWRCDFAKLKSEL